MRFNVFSSVSTPTTMPAQSQPRPTQVPPTPLEKPSKLGGVVRTVLQVLHLRRSTPKRTPTLTENPKLIVTSAVPLTTATPSTTASVAALATISPLFEPQHAESTPTPATACSCPCSSFPSPQVATDLIAANNRIAELESAIARLKRQLEEAHQTRVMKAPARSPVVWYKSGGTRASTRSPSPTTRPSRLLRQGGATDLGDAVVRASLFGSDDSCWDDFYPPEPYVHRELRGTGEDSDYDDEFNPKMSPRGPHGARY